MSFVARRGLNHLRIVRKRCSDLIELSALRQVDALRALTQASNVPQQQIRRHLRVVVCILNTLNSNKRIGIFSAEIFTIQAASLISSDPNPIASCELKPFWFRN